MKLKYGPYSPSRLETAECLYSFYRQYVDPEKRIKRIEDVAQARGSVVHEVFEKLTEIMKQDTSKHLEIPREYVLRLVSGAVTRHPAAQAEIRDIYDMIAKYIAHPPKVLTRDAQLEMRLAVKSFLNGEWIMTDYDSPDAFVRGRADIFMISDDTTTAYLYDHKTQPNKEEADTFQLGVYAWVISKIYPFLDEIRTILHFARYGYYSSHVVWVKNEEIKQNLIAKAEVDPNYIVNLQHVEDELLTRIFVIEATTEWTAQPHKGCGYCPVKFECPLLEDLWEKGPDGNLRPKGPFRILGDTASAVKVAGLINLISVLEKEMNDELKEHVRLSGPIAIPGKCYCFKAEEVIDWDVVNKRLKKHAYGVFEKFNEDPREFMGFSQTFSKGIPFHKNEMLSKELLELFPRKITSMFRGVKV